MPLVPLVDTHCHILFGALANDADGAWQRARSAGVVQALVVGIDAPTSAAAVHWVQNKPGLFATVGIHPNDTGPAQDRDYAEIAALCARPKVVALGETGLDFYRDTVNPGTQCTALEWHAEQGLALKLPLVLHVRDAFPRLREVVAPFAARGLRAVIHCFGGEPQDIHPFVDWDWPISFSGILTYRGAPLIREAAKLVPEHLLLIETDSPWLAPDPQRGKVNEPAYVALTAKRLSEIRGCPIQELAALTTRNARRFFGLPETGPESGV